MEKTSISAEEAIDQVYKYGGKILGKDVTTVAEQAEKAKGIFGKAKQLVAYGKDIMNILSMLKDYASGAYTEVPWRVIAALTGGVVYVFSPVDLIPDLIPLFGFADDATVFASVLSLSRLDINAYLLWKKSRGEKIEGGSSEDVESLPVVDKSADITNWSLTNFQDVVRSALSSLKGTAIHWFWGDDHVAEFSENIHGKIMGGNGSIKDVIGVIDLEAFEHCKEGFAFTDERIYFRQFAEHGFSYRWRDIISFERVGAKFYINGIPLENICHDEENAERVYKVILAMLNRAELTPEGNPLDVTRRRSKGQIVHDIFFSVPKGDCIYVGENIPEKKRMNAHQAMGVREPPEAIAVLIDGTLLGSGKDGIALTNRALYGNGWGSRCRIEWNDLMFVQDNGSSAVALSKDGQTVLYLGAADPQRGVICECINKIREEECKEVSRCLQAKMDMLRAFDLEKAHRYLGKTVADFESEDAFIAAGKAAEEKMIEETTISAETKADKEGRASIVDNVPLTGGWKIACGRYCLNEPIKVGENVRLFVKDAEIHFGNKGWIELCGGQARFENCRLVCDGEACGESEGSGNFMVVGKTSGSCFLNCDFNGRDHRAAFVLDGEVNVQGCVFQDLFSNRQGGAILGSSHKKDMASKLVLNECSFVNCRAKSQAVVWAMEAIVTDCEFVKCTSPVGIVCVVEDSDFYMTKCMFDQCEIAPGGAALALYVNGGSTMVEGGGICLCRLKDCKCQYTHNPGIPLSSLGGWVDEQTYKVGGIGEPPLFLRDGLPLRKKIGAQIVFGEVACNATPAKTKRRSKPSGGAGSVSSGCSKHKDEQETKLSSEATDASDDESRGRPAQPKRKRPSKSAERCEVSRDVSVEDGAAEDETPTKKRKGKETKTAVAKKKSSKDDAARKERQEAEPTVSDVENKKTKTAVSQKKPPETKSRKVSSAKPSVRIDVQAAVKKALMDLGKADFYEGQSIPAKKLKNAIESMGIGSGERVYALIDTTLFGSAKNGLAITNLGVHWKNDWATDSDKSFYSWAEFSAIAPKMTTDKFDVVFSKGSRVSTAGSGVEPDELKKVLETIVSLTT